MNYDGVGRIAKPRGIYFWTLVIWRNVEELLASTYSEKDELVKSKVYVRTSTEGIAQDK
jgi:hypothetical protein